jgi:hypothetical protein
MWQGRPDVSTERTLMADNAESDFAGPGTTAFRSLSAEKRPLIAADITERKLTNLRIASLRAVPFSLVAEIRLRLRDGRAV